MDVITSGGTMQPSVGRIVHYVSHGTPVQADGTQAFKSECRAAIVTEVESYSTTVGLCVTNPTGLFFHSLSDGGVAYDAGMENDHNPVVYQAGTWHWPERV